MKKILLVIALVAVGALMAGCDSSSAGPSNAELMQKPQPSNNPNIPTVDAKNQEFGEGTQKRGDAPTAASVGNGGSGTKDSTAASGTQ